MKFTRQVSLAVVLAALLYLGPHSPLGRNTGSGGVVAGETPRNPETSGSQEPHIPGEDIATAFPISTLPFLANGSTVSFANDYDEACIQSFTSNSPDVVYQYTSSTTVCVDISLCASSYDTKMFIYEDSATAGMPFACNEDVCGVDGYRSALRHVRMLEEHTYFI